MKYIAFKLQGLSYWLWFEREKAVQSDITGNWECKDGWGKGGNLISASINLNDITSTIYSDSPNYL